MPARHCTSHTGAVVVGIDVVEVLLDFVRIITHQTSDGQYAFDVRDCMDSSSGARAGT